LSPTGDAKLDGRGPCDSNSDRRRDALTLRASGLELKPTEAYPNRGAGYALGHHLGWSVTVYCRWGKRDGMKIRRECNASVGAVEAQVMAAPTPLK
jgi:hypothetical protein